MNPLQIRHSVLDQRRERRRRGRVRRQQRPPRRRGKGGQQRQDREAHLPRLLQKRRPQERRVRRRLREQPPRGHGRPHPPHQGHVGGRQLQGGQVRRRRGLEEEEGGLESRVLANNQSHASNLVVQTRDAKLPVLKLTQTIPYYDV